jgi:hypothetical protein
VILIAGRKGKFEEWLTEDGLTTVEGWARDGLTDEQIAHNIGIAERTFTDWKDRFPAISAALKKGKAPVDIQVENALLKRALGQIVKVKKPIKLKHKGQIPGKGLIEEERIEYAEEEVYIPPDTTAQIFWLKNRRPDKWRDKVEAAPEGNNVLLQSLLDLERQAAR